MCLPDMYLPDMYLLAMYLLDLAWTEACGYNGTEVESSSRSVRILPYWQFYQCGSALSEPSPRFNGGNGVQISRTLL
jgi:hypothetical protein